MDVYYHGLGMSSLPELLSSGLPYSSLSADLGVLVGSVQGLVGYMHIAVGTFWEGLGAFIGDADGALWVFKHEVRAHGLWGWDPPVWTVRDWARMVSWDVWEFYLVVSLIWGWEFVGLGVEVRLIDSVLCA